MWIIDFLLFMLLLSSFAAIPFLFIPSVLILIYSGLVYIFSKYKHKRKPKYHMLLIKAAAIIVVVVPICIFTVTIISVELDLHTTKSDKVYSPDGEHFVQIEESNCGATCHFNTNVVLNNTKNPFSFSIVLSARSGNREGVFGVDSAFESVSASWINNDTLKVKFSRCSQIYGQDKSWKDIKIVYEGKCSRNY